MALTESWWRKVLGEVLEMHSPCLLDEEMKNYKGLTRTASTALLEWQLNEFEKSAKKFLSTARWCLCYQEPPLKYGDADGRLQTQYCNYIREHIKHSREMGDAIVAFIKEHTR